MKIPRTHRPRVAPRSPRRRVVVAPIAACEQHSDHLPTYTDTILVTAVAEAWKQRLNNQVLLLPTLWLGASDHHLAFGGRCRSRPTLMRSCW